MTARMNSKLEAGVGFCLLFTPEEMKLVEAHLEEAELPLTKEGLKEFILCGGFEDERSPAERLRDKLQDTIEEHPEAVRAAMKATMNGLNYLWKNRHRR